MTGEPIEKQQTAAVLPSYDFTPINGKEKHYSIYFDGGNYMQRVIDSIAYQRCRGVLLGSLQTGVQGLARDISEVVTMTTRDGWGSSGLTDHPFRIMGIIFDQQRYSTTLELEGVVPWE
jgi:hypothetical protein